MRSSLALLEEESGLMWLCAFTVQLYVQFRTSVLKQSVWLFTLGYILFGMMLVQTSLH